MRIYIGNEFAKYKLYRDLTDIINSYRINEKMFEMPEIEDYHYSYFEKLWELLDIQYSEGEKTYAMAEIWAWKGTKKIFPLFEKWFGVTIRNRDVVNGFNGRTLEVVIDITYRGNTPQLLKVLITDYFRFLLFYTEFKLIYENLRHIIDVYYKRDLKTNFVSFINVDGTLLTD